MLCLDSGVKVLLSPVGTAIVPSKERHTRHGEIQAVQEDSTGMKGIFSVNCFVITTKLFEIFTMGIVIDNEFHVCIYIHTFIDSLP